MLVRCGWRRSHIGIHYSAVSDRQLRRVRDLALHLAGAFRMSVAFSVRPAALAYPAKEYCEGEDQRSKASTNGSTDDGSVVLIASGWGGCCSGNCTCWSPDGVGCCLREIDR